MSMWVRRFKHSIKETIYKIIPSPYRNYSYAQAGEDVVLDFLLQQVHLTQPRYLEIGVYEPIECNNTYKFYQRGAQGVLVEADETLLPFVRHTRPRDTLVHCGVGTSTKIREADFYVFDVKGANTFSKEEALAREKAGPFKIEKVVKVPLLTINEIIERHFDTYPDFLSIDIEGLDLPVLKTVDYERFPIPIICAETCTYSASHIKDKDLAIAEFLATQGYFVYADTYINTLFVKKDWFYSFGK
jgi:FkbM family methyltransferase